MKNYKIYFEIYGKRLVTTVSAENQEHAKQIIVNKIIFHKIILTDDNDDIFSQEDNDKPTPSDYDNLDYLKNILGIKD
jgi:hypothetical protein